MDSLVRLAVFLVMRVGVMISFNYQLDATSNHMVRVSVKDCLL